MRQELAAELDVPVRGGLVERRPASRGGSRSRKPAARPGIGGTEKSDSSPTPSPHCKPASLSAPWPSQIWNGSLVRAQVLRRELGFHTFSHHMAHRK